QAAYLRAFALDPLSPEAPQELRGLGWSQTMLTELQQMIDDEPDARPPSAAGPSRNGRWIKPAAFTSKLDFPPSQSSVQAADLSGSNDFSSNGAIQGQREQGRAAATGWKVSDHPRKHL